MPLGAGKLRGTHPKLADISVTLLEPAAGSPGDCFMRWFASGRSWSASRFLLGRFVEIGTELYAMAASCARAQALLQRAEKEQSAGLLELVDYFCRSSRLRIERAFDGLRHNAGPGRVPGGAAGPAREEQFFGRGYSAQ